MFFPFPDKIFDDVTCIRPEFLRQAGIRGLLLDIDGTLAQTRQPAPSPAVDAWLAEMRRSGVALYILSNNKSPERTRAFAERIGCGWRHRSHKPGRRALRRRPGSWGWRPGSWPLWATRSIPTCWGACGPACTR